MRGISKLIGGRGRVSSLFSAIRIPMSVAKLCWVVNSQVGRVSNGSDNLLNQVVSWISLTQPERSSWVTLQNTRLTQPTWLG